ncbi:MAG: peptidoglycan-associated lipoprotein Pal [Novosphingobium sp.]
MPTRASLKTAALILMTSAALAACTKKPPKELPPEPGTATATENGGDGSLGRAIPGSQADFVAQMMGADTIFFDTDRYNIDSQDAAALAQQAQWLSRYPGKKATIEGHCDERGTRDYNLALGERRANAAKNYLVSQGIDSARLTTVSLGKERPLALGSDEAAWAKNRRAVTITLD